MAEEAVGVVAIADAVVGEGFVDAVGVDITLTTELFVYCRPLIVLGVTAS